MCRDHDQEAKDRLRYREHPIYGTDFSKPVSLLIEELRQDMVRLRGRIHDIEHGTGWEDRVDHVAGLLTCGIVALHVSKEEIEKAEIQWDDEKFGKSIKFGSRGVGLDMCPGCFVCGSTIREEGANAYMNNIAAFVKSKEDGEEVVRWFEQLSKVLGKSGGARLDFRSFEPNWIQVKVGACNKHLPNLQHLSDKTSVHGVVRKCDIEEAQAIKPGVCPACKKSGTIGDGCASCPGFVFEEEAK